MKLFCFISLFLALLWLPPPCLLQLLNFGFNLDVMFSVLITGFVFHLVFSFLLSAVQGC